MASPTNPDLYTPVRFWSMPNQGFYARFRKWLRGGGYSDSALRIYGCAVRLAISQLDKPYWQIDAADLDQIRALIVERFPSEGTRAGYFKGLAKLDDFLRQLQGKPRPPKLVNWPCYLNSLPEWLADDIRAYIRHCRRRWLAEVHQARTQGTLSRLTRFLRFAAETCPLPDLAALNAECWFNYLDARLAAGIQAATLNNELYQQQNFLHFLAGGGRTVCRRLLAMEELPDTKSLPQDVPLEQLRRLQAAILNECARDHAGVHRTAQMDRAWFLLMLHSGLRTGEVRYLRRENLDLEARRVHIVQSKGLKDRLVCLSRPTVAALKAYLPLRGPVDDDHVFIYRHRPLTVTYCRNRLRTYGKRCGVIVNCHQLRHSCATLLLNAGAPILTVQTLLGHKHIDTTLGYARLYDGTVAADYYRAMAHIEQRLELAANAGPPPVTPAGLLTLVDALAGGRLNDDQSQLIHDLRGGLLTLAEQAEAEAPANGAGKAAA